MKTELAAQGVLLAEGGAATRVMITLSESWKQYVWTAEIGGGDASRAIVLAVARDGGDHAASNAMHVVVRSERFWEGPERILDAAEISNGRGQSWLVLMTPSGLAIEDLQTGSSSKIGIAPGTSNSRDPWGQLGPAPLANEVWFRTFSQVCKVSLEMQGSPDCLSNEELSRSGRFPMMLDLSPRGPLPTGTGIALMIPAVCGGSEQFVATSAGDDTQTDTVQVFQTEPNGPVPMSGEVSFPGPILALHTGTDAPRTIVRNLSTGNYEAYRLAISCGE